MKRNGITPNKNENNNHKNAFAMMMSSGGSSNSGTKKRKCNTIIGNTNTINTPTKERGKSRFVCCPVGCGKHILPHEINKHIDDCLLRQQQKQTENEQKQKQNQCDQKLQSQPQPQSQPPVLSPSPSPSPLPSLLSPSPSSNMNEPEKLIEHGDNNDRDETECECEEVAPHNSLPSTTIIPEGAEKRESAISPSPPDVFLKLLQRMHLHENGSVSVTCYHNNNVINKRNNDNDNSSSSSSLGTIAWMSTVQVRGNKERGSLPIELIVSSSIPSLSLSSSQNHHRLVQNHTKLSVPVLKSILQKSIRRRKPLPSIRIASELIDKSLGDVLRRLPIIILEDSTYHPKFPFLIWLMISVSKHYIPSLEIKKQILCIVYEISSCRYQDHIITSSTTTAESGGRQDQNEDLSLASIHRNVISDDNDDTHSNDSKDQHHQHQPCAVLLKDDGLIIWSILMRSHYGGMAGDVRMLHIYAQIWYERLFFFRSIFDDTKKRLLGDQKKGDSDGNDDDVYNLEEWIQVPSYIHKSSSLKQQSSMERIDHHIRSLSAISQSDITIEGIDFYCSSILESTILNNDQLVRECCNELQRINIRNTPSDFSSSTNRRSWLERST
ncbi:hypothetical protein FRACYDRAFT_247207 [Fragilariopsis cylindrus CCMP1102]|uniref:UBZ4-type domain-containing protein n=1 Tax=Fragilariopsis cylindrus CCMP1102 TaxID=635003 RepID=A0A1E7EXV6_9STRA|nr:hypothetical protein FRACYDRAFT_247207 [Fragilariopsis cylindrus CCMP1102]|eukprot:OEU10666.1 hypothetical protein FRACYDRAFT_247207 [Fragilariopsis cylindrus CCMP1102]